MHLGFIIFRYFPFGGLQRQMFSLSKACIEKGHSLTIFTSEWIGDRLPEMRIVELPVKTKKSIKKELFFCKSLDTALIDNKPDIVVGFNKVPNLDAYYCGDTCYAEKAYEKRNLFYRYTFRCRQNIFFEKMVFGKNKKTQIVIIEPTQSNAFIKYYQTEKKRFHYIPPGIDRDRIAPQNREEIGNALRKNIGIPCEWNLLTLIGSNLALKGIDRALNALHSLPDNVKSKTLLLLVGDDKDADQHLKKAKNLNLTKQVRFIGPRKDIPHILFASDLLLHPAYREATGNVILEGTVAGVPVLCTGVCGFSPYITNYDLGKVIQEPFNQKIMNKYLLEMLSDKKARKGWAKNAAQFAEQADIYDRPMKFVEFLETTFLRKVNN